MLLDVNEIQSLLPHRYPFAMLDRVVELERGSYIVALKNITINELHFQGHFPGNPMFPGVLVIECLAQASGVLTMVSENAKPEEGQSYMLVGIDKVRFKRPIVPGDQLMLRSEIVTNKRGIWKYRTEARVDQNLVVSAEILCAQAEV